MVVLNNPNTKYENVKNKYLVKKNMEYMKLEDDEVNKKFITSWYIICWSIIYILIYILIYYSKRIDLLFKDLL